MSEFKVLPLPGFLKPAGRMGRTTVPHCAPAPDDAEAQAIWQSRAQLQQMRQLRALENPSVQLEILKKSIRHAEKKR